MTRLSSDRRQPVELRFGSDDTLSVWLNGKLIHSVETYRGAEPDQEVVAAVLEQGENTLVAKVGQDVAGWELLFRLTGPDGARISGVSDGFDRNAWASYSADRPTERQIIGQPPSYAWRVMGPIRVDAAQLTADVLPSDVAAVASAGDASARDWQRIAADKVIANRIDLNDVLGSTGGAVAYVATVIEVDRETEAQIVSGSDDGLALWLDGQRIYTALEPRVFAPESDRVPVTLKPGRHVLLARVSQGGGEWLVQIDVLDDQGRPLGAKPVQPN